MSREFETAIMPASTIVNSKGIMPKFESILNKERLDVMPGDNSGCYAPPPPCQACYRGCVGYNVISEDSQLGNLIKEKLRVGSARSAEVPIQSDLTPFLGRTE